MSRIYLTLDDAPSSDFINKVEFLESVNMPAIFFCRGDFLEKRMDEAVYALNKGFLLGSHSYRHIRHSHLSRKEAKASILRNHELLEMVYQKANMRWRTKLFRFPYLDRGCGSFPVNPDDTTEEGREWLAKIMLGVVGESDVPSLSALANKDELQRFLKELGYISIAEEIEQAGFSDTDFGRGSDVNITYCSDDWHMLSRHRPRYQDTPEILCERLRNYLEKSKLAAEIILMHDYEEEYAKEAFKKMVETLVSIA